MIQVSKKIVKIKIKCKIMKNGNSFKILFSNNNKISKIIRT